MLYQYRTTFIVGALLLLLTPNACFRTRRAIDLDENIPAGLSDDELSYALSNLSVDDLNDLNQLLDVINENRGEVDMAASLSSDQLARFKRETQLTKNADESILNAIPNQDDEYIRQLDDSFPNVEQSNQDDKERAHIRVKRN